MIRQVQLYHTNKYNPCFGTIKAMPPNALEVIESGIILLKRSNKNSSSAEEREFASATHFLADTATEALELAKTMSSSLLFKKVTEGKRTGMCIEITGIDGKTRTADLVNMPSQKSLISVNDVVYASARLLNSFTKIVKQAHTEEELAIETILQKARGGIN